METNESLREIENLRFRFQMNNRLRLESLAALSKVFRDNGEPITDQLLAGMVFALPQELVSDNGHSHTRDKQSARSQKLGVVGIPPEGPKPGGTPPEGPKPKPGGTPPEGPKPKPGTPPEGPKPKPGTPPEGPKPRPGTPPEGPKPRPGGVPPEGPKSGY